MKKPLYYLFLLLSCIVSLISCSKEGLEQVEDVCSKIEDPVFMLYCYENFDLNGDKRVSMREAATVKSLSLSRMEIESLKGIEYFTSLVELTVRENRIKRMDLSYNTNLKMVDARENDLTSINVSSCHELTDLVLRKNKLKSIDVSKCLNLQNLELDDNNLKKLNVNNNEVLYRLDISNNSISSIDISSTSLEGGRIGKQYIDGSILNMTVYVNSRQMQNMILLDLDYLSAFYTFVVK